MMWERVVTDDLVLWQIKPWREYSWLLHGFTTRSIGNLALHTNDRPEAVLHRRELLAERVKVFTTEWVAAQQVHGDQIVTVTEENQGYGAFSYDTAFPATDGLITDRKRTFLTTYYADCVPLYFLAPEQRVIALAHAGWRGTAKEIGRKLVFRLINDYRIDVKTIQVGIAPSVGSCCYCVDEEVAKQFPEKALKNATHGKYFLDLTEANKLQLIESGIEPANIFCANVCTCCESEFFSYRREGEKAGRMAAFIMIK